MALGDLAAPVTSDRKVVVLDDAEALAHEAASVFSRRAQEGAQMRGRFNVALSGGSTPKRLCQLLADEGEPYRARIPWDRVHLFWCDERHVPPDDPESNYRMVREALLSKLGSIPPKNVHRIEGEHDDAAQAAAVYEDEIRSSFGLTPGGFPRFDLVLLGMGQDGHTASLFPGNAALAVRDRLVAAPWIDRLNCSRITLTVPVFNHAAAACFLVCGGDKAATLRAVLEGPAETFPCHLIRPHDGELVWLVDRPAASLLGSP